MSLTLPTVDDLVSFWGDAAEDVDEDRAQLLLELAASLLWTATGLDADPEDSRLALLVKYAILDMAVYLFITRDSINESYGPFQSERIGSYSYSKAYTQAVRNASSGTPTGVLFFDKLLEFLLNDALYGGCGALSSEHVFHQGYQPLYFASTRFLRFFREADPNMDRRAIYGYFGNADDDEGVYR